MATLVPRSAHSDKRAVVEAAVLAATESLLLEGRTFADLRVEEIATRAGISRTAFYFYFRGKRELLMRLTEGVAELSYEGVATWWDDEEDGRAALREAVERVVDVWARHAVLMRAVVEAASYDDVVAQFWRGVGERFVERTAQRIEADGIPVDPEGTAFALCWMGERACYQWVVQEREFDDPRLVEGLVAVWTRTLYGH